MLPNESTSLDLGKPVGTAQHSNGGRTTFGYPMNVATTIGDMNKAHSLWVPAGSSPGGTSTASAVSRSTSALSQRSKIRRDSVNPSDSDKNQFATDSLVDFCQFIAHPGKFVSL